MQVFDSGEDEPSSRHFIVMEYVNGPSCADLLREHRRLGVEQTVDIVRGSCHGGPAGCVPGGAREWRPCPLPRSAP